MKIALVRKKYSPYGGAERYMDALAKRLVALGHEVHVFANQWESEPGEESKGPGALRFHRVPVVCGGSLFKVLSFAFNVRRLLNAETFDVIHGFERAAGQDIYRAGDGCHREWLAQRAKYESFLKRLLVRSNPLHWAVLSLERKIFDPRNTKLIIANSERGKAEIVRHYGFPGERIRVIYNGVDRSCFSPETRKTFRAAVRNALGLSEGDTLLLFMGSGFERKGLRFAIDALHRLNDPRMRLLVVGKDNPGKYRKRAARHGVLDRVVFHGAARNPERFHAAADLFILPSIYEPFSNACLEAMACGVPVVTTRINGVSEIIEQTLTGVCVDDPANIEQVSRAVNEALAMRRDVATKNTEEMLERLTIENHVKETIRVYAELHEAA